MRRLTWMAAYLAALAAAAPAPGEEAPAKARWLEWQRLPAVPAAPGEAKQLGLVGAFAGVHDDALILAGGAVLEEDLLAEPQLGRPRPHIFVLTKRDGDSYAWVTDGDQHLRRPLAYGSAVATADGVLCIGGFDGKQCSRDVFLLKWDRAKRKVTTEGMPPLPRPLAFAAAAKVGDIVYVAGGVESPADGRPTTHFLALDLAKAKDDANVTWEALERWPGPPRSRAVAAAQSDGTTDCFYLFGGWRTVSAGPIRLLTDAYSYNPQTRRWTTLAGASAPQRTGLCVAGGSAVASGANHILVFGAEKEQFVDVIPLVAGQVERVYLLSGSREIGHGVWGYHTITGTWARGGELPAGAAVQSSAVRWGEAVVLPAGRSAAGEATAEVYLAKPAPPPAFGAINYAVLGVYLLALVGMGVYFSRRERTTDDFFKAGGRIPWWAAGLSIFGTQLSALTFMAIPAKTFATDWRYFIGNMAIVMAAPFIVLLFLPFYRRLNVTTAYEYLERRFNLAARLLGSAMFMLLQFGRIGIVLFLPSLALSLVTGMDVRACILAMGVLCIVYTVLGGIEAVIWTDVLQVIVLVGGAVFCLVLIAFGVPGGWDGVHNVADAAGKLRVFDFRFDLKAATFWALLLGGLGANLISYGTDQTVIQRYLTTRNERAAARGIWTNAVLCIPASLLFFGIGTALFAFFRAHPSALSPTIEKPDAIFPWYIVTQLPVGVAGLLIAAVFAAAMSSLDSSMNSVATAFTTDFYRRFRPAAPDRRCLALARAATIAIGLLGTAFALMMAEWKIKSLWDQFAKVLGLFGGGLGGLFLLAIFTRRAHGVGAIVGLAASGGTQLLLRWADPFHPWFYAVTGIVSCFAIGYAASLLIPLKRKPLEGLTIHTLAARSD